MNQILIKKQLKQTDAALIVSSTLTQLGIASGELSYSKALSTYGTWFSAAVKRGLITPVRIGEGTKSKKWYSVCEILALKAAELEQAEINISR